ncbi:hypothetical protein Shyd_86450 [Streptomyces hydrogenans]|uniref:CsbD family protein n=1 Tax=Streptomyces hydrogenans TaxID=1873719 RepID=A0ABQ3PQK4_9ACTN|nr:hypothetical protein GCM10018784_42610 [Streptomyces hydrogenans]GHI27274.1 hypothetical protein Shyd_86450 [Streptomyces hydrogenans]
MFILERSRPMADKVKGKAREAAGKSEEQARGVKDSLRGPRNP